ncbi:hypothetical protein IGK74_002321 [Enterococcus sp. AZ150]|uniref:replication initiator protein A n=1 Tax=Enterococcus sp. AZ150 TaxID=2774866 RepID=UPI003F28EE37
MFEFYKAKEVYREKYYQMPTIFFTSDRYKQLSNDAKIAYMLLKDRFDYSVKNNWIDSEGYIYFIYTNSELMNLLNCGKGKIAKIKKELESANLLKQKINRVSLGNGNIKNAPNLLYLGKPFVSSADVFQIESDHSKIIDSISFNSAKVNNTNDSIESPKIEPSKKVSNINDSIESPKIEPSKKANNTNGSIESPKIEHNLLDSLKDLDTNRHYIDTKKDEQESIILDNFVNLMSDPSINTFIPVSCLQLIKVFSQSFSEAQETVKIIHRAKNKAEQETNCIIVFEEFQVAMDLEKQLYRTLLKAYQFIKHNEVASKENLIFIYVKNWFIEYPIHAKKQLEKDVPKISLHNWLDD